MTWDQEMLVFIMVKRLISERDSSQSSVLSGSREGRDVSPGFGSPTWCWIGFADPTVKRQFPEMAVSFCTRRISQLPGETTRGLLIA